MAEIKWTEESVRWMSEIFDYIAEENPVAAHKVVKEIYAKVQILISFPEIGQKYRNEPEGEIRIMLYGHYRIAYLIKYNVVEILGIFHGALKIEQYLNKSILD